MNNHLKKISKVEVFALTKGLGLKLLYGGRLYIISSVVTNHLLIPPAQPPPPPLNRRSTTVPLDFTPLYQKQFNNKIAQLPLQSMNSFPKLLAVLHNSNLSFPESLETVATTKIGYQQN